MPDKPPWKVGDLCAYFHSDWTAATTSPVVCVGKRDVVLADGHRFQADKPRQRISRSHRRGYYLISTRPDDPEFIYALAATEAAQAKAAALRDCGHVARIETLQAARAAHASLNAWLQAESELEAVRAVD